MFRSAASSELCRCVFLCLLYVALDIITSSLLTTFSTILERVAYKQSDIYLCTHNINDVFQLGFRAERIDAAAQSAMFFFSQLEKCLN